MGSLQGSQSWLLVYTKAKHPLHIDMIALIFLLSPLAGSIIPSVPVEQTLQNSPSVHPFFIPPKDWSVADPKLFAQSVQACFIGKNKKGFTPSVNLAVEKSDLSCAEYLKIVKQLHESDKGNRWRDLGHMNTRAGKARITEIDSKTEWGQIRMLQSILAKDGCVYILTAAALKEEFMDYYEDFEKVIRSFTITADLSSEIPQSKKREKLEQQFSLLKKAWNSSSVTSDARFSDKNFQKNHWIPFQKCILNDFKEMGPYWQALVLQTAQEYLE